MSARTITEMSPEQALFRPISSGCGGGSEGTFAQSLTHNLEKVGAVLPQHPGALSMSQNSPSTSQGSSGNLTQCLRKAQSPGLHHQDEVGTEKPEIGIAFPTAQPSSTDKAEPPGQQGIEIQLPPSKGVQRQDRALPATVDASNSCNQEITPASPDASPKRDTSSAKEKAKSILLEASSANLNAVLPNQIPLMNSAVEPQSTQAGSKEAPCAVAPKDPVLALQPLSASSPLVSSKGGSLAAPPAVAESTLVPLPDQFAEGQLDSIAAKGASVTIASDLSSGDLRPSGSTPLLSKAAADRIAEATAIVSISVPPTVTSTVGLERASHHIVSFTPGAALAAGSEEQSVFVDASGAIEDAPRTLTASGSTLEVGVQSATHGWLRVRAELTDNGTVNASLAVTTSLSQVALHKELPGLTAYLQQENLSVNSIVIHPAALFGPASHASHAASGDGGGGQKQPDGDRRQDPGASGRGIFGNTSQEDGEENWSERGQEALSRTASPFSGAGLLSVLA